jgi:hypothetical protein
LDEHASLNAVEHGKMLIEQYSVAAHDEDRAADLLDHDGNRTLRLSRGQRDYPVRAA